MTKRLITAIFLLLLVPSISGAAWKMNPFTGKMDYYEPGGVTTEVDPSAIKKNGVSGNGHSPQ